MKLTFKNVFGDYDANTQKLARRVMRQMGYTSFCKEWAQTVKDAGDHGADAGWGGFTYYSDTIDFFKKNKKEILLLLNDDAESFGVKSAFAVVQQFRNGSDYDHDEIARALYGRLKSDDTQVPNVLAWYALEHVGRIVSDFVYEHKINLND